ncbi:dihydrolipoyl dehydrogenase [Alkalicoccus saliphilus]|uniref:Dihydrolipoyl dehydrogenase n=1 Tax=Alkalicoccus saliphilus TaxID=200989 RepID=A0A2T4U4M5_9BACI|nr:dihydrolipoyl dehydrogenase [Alkalicoccus saliphilus]PTL38366.1 dihydrolipoyl dehydrogenase [Alkalicoccus saliphilus]
MEKYDLIIIGGGPGGYVSALRASTKGYRTALVEARELGGTCLNRGCIPSKTFLKNADVLTSVENSGEKGIDFSGVSISMPKMVEHKNNILTKLRSGIDYLLKKNHIDHFESYAEISEDKIVSLSSGENLQGKKIIIASGSQPFIPPIPGIEKIKYETTDSIFDLKEIPASMCIIGGGIIGVECADIFSSFGTKVTVIEMGEQLIPSEDKEAAYLIQEYLSEKGVSIYTNTSVKNMESHNDEVIIECKGNEEETIQLNFNKILIATGRKPNTEVVERLNLRTKENAILVDDFMETSEPGIFAVGDVIGGWQLAHAASAEGLTAVNNLYEKRERINYSVMPRCVYTNLEVASVGKTEKELINEKITYTTKKLPLEGNGKAGTLGVNNGFTKIMFNKDLGEIYGVIMVGPNVTEIISQASAYMYLEGTIDEMAEMVQPHPSLSEILLEVANFALNKPLHS